MREYTNRHLTTKIDGIAGGSVSDSSLSDDFYWGSGNTLEVSVGAIPGGVTLKQVTTAIDAVDSSLVTYSNAAVNAVDTSLVTYSDSLGINISQFPTEDASFNNGDYMFADSSILFKSNDVWYAMDASTVFP